jgi:uncharacterized damage-inducible protein DinB
MSPSSIRAGAVLASLTLIAFAQQKIPPGIGKGWLPEFDHAAGQTLALAEATPADKFGWRPGPGIRSIAEVHMHLALSNFYLMGMAGAKVPEAIAPQLKPGVEKTVTAKADVIKWLKESQEFVRSNYAKVDGKRPVKFISGDTNADGVLLRILLHNHEHMGQSIAYARMAGVKPPWSE